MKAFFRQVLCWLLSLSIASTGSLSAGLVLPNLVYAAGWNPAPLNDTDIKTNSGAGQGDGMNYLGNQQTAPKTANTYGSKSGHTTGCSTAGGCTQSNNQEIYVNDFATGDTIDQNTMQGYASNPDLLNVNSRARRDNLRDRNCRQTAFVQVSGQAGQVVLRGKVVERTTTRVQSANPPYKMVSTNTDATGVYTGVINVQFPTMGSGRVDEVTLRPASSGNPSLILIYEKTPFAADSSKYFTYNHQVVAISGAINGSLTSYGNGEDGYKTRASITGTNLSEFVVTADLYEIQRTYTPPPAIGACTPDPVGCVLNGVNFCAGSVGEGIADVFLNASDLTANGGKKAGKVKSDTVVENLVLDGYAHQKPTISNDADMSIIANHSNSMIDGKHPIYSEVFTGCNSETVSTSYYESAHHANIKSCVAVPINPDSNGCTAQRLNTFTKIASGAQVVRGSFYPLINGMPGAIKTAWTGTLNLSLRTVGNPVSGVQIPVDAKTVLIVDYNTPLVDVNENVSTNHVVTVVGGGGSSGSSSYYGSPSDGYASQVTITGTAMTDFAIQADLFYMATKGFSGCAARLTASSDGFCSVPATCTNTMTSFAGMPLTGPGAGALEVLEKWGANPSGSFELAPKNCWAISAGQDSCSTIPYDQSNQYSNSIGDAGFVDNCAYRGVTASSCKLVSKNVCQKSLVGPVSGTCYGYDVQYDCGFDVNNMPAGSASRTIAACTAPIRCMGTECANFKPETNNDFGQAAGQAQTLQYMKYDFKCAESGERPHDTNSPCTPVIFEGKNLQCGIPEGNSIGLLPNCCEQGDTAAAGVDPNAVIQAFDLLYRVVDKQAMANMMGNVPGYNNLVKLYDSTATQVSDAVSSVTKPMVDGFTNIIKDMGWDITKKTSVDAGKNAVAPGSGSSPSLLGDLGSQIGQTLANAAESALNFLSPGTGTAVSQAASAVMSSEVAKMAAQGLNILMAAYTVYNVLKLVGTLAYQCKQDEIELGFSKRNRECHYVGRYCSVRLKNSDFAVGAILAPGVAIAIKAGAKEGNCIEEKESSCCYSSPLARIISEQLRLQGVGGPWGDPEMPNCSGFSPDDLTSADWSKVELKEWTNMLIEAGILANDVQSANALYDINKDPALNRYGMASFGPDGPQTPQTVAMNSFGDTAPVPTSGSYSSTTRIGVNRENREYLETQKVCYASGQKSLGWYDINLKPEDVVTEVGGKGGYQTACTPPAPNQGCMDIILPVLMPGTPWTGAVPDNNLDENCTTGWSTDYTLFINRPDLVVSATVDELQFDDHLIVRINDNPVWVSHEYYNPNVCELGKHWCAGNKITPNSPGESCTAEPTPAPVDVTSTFQQYGEIKTSVNVRVGDKGEGFARIRVIYNVPVMTAGATACIDPLQP